MPDVSKAIMINVHRDMNPKERPLKFLLSFAIVLLVVASVYVLTYGSPYFSIFLISAAVYLWGIGREATARGRFDRLTHTAFQTWFNVGLILGLVMWLHAGTWVPTGDSVKDREMRPRADFMMFYGSALVLQNSATQLYDQNRQAAAQRLATGLEISESDIDFLPFPYPAVVALAFVPLTFFAYHTAYLIMILINFTMLGIIVWILSTGMNLEREETQVLVLCLTASLPVYAVLVEGQVSFFSLLFYALAITDLRKGHSRRAGIWAGLLAFKPTLVPALFFWFAVRRQWQALGWAVLVAGAMAMLSILLVGIDGSLGYIDISLKMAQEHYYTGRSSSMPNLRGIVGLWGGGMFAWSAAIGLVFGALAFFKHKGPQTEWDHCALVMATILAAPHLLIQELVLTLIVIALVLARLKGHVTAAWRWLLLLLMGLPAVYFDWPGVQEPQAAVIAYVILPIFLLFGFQSLAGPPEIA